MPALLPAWTFGLLAVAGTAYTLLAARAVARLGRAPRPSAPAEPVTLLKPLHGAEPRLAANLATFFRQDWDAPVEMVAGVSDPADPAATVARDAGAIVIADATRHGANGKVSNLVNMDRAARHDLLVLSDSDMAVPRDYLHTIAGALAAPGTGAVTCLYRGRGDAGGWSMLAAAGISYQFLPSVALGLRHGLARPCMGSTIALRRTTLDAIGGFARFADRLADDYEIGAAVRGLGLAVAVPPMILVHACDERGAGAVWRHERRWAATLRRVDPAGYVGMAVTYPVAWALAALPFAPLPGLALLLGAAGARLVLKGMVDRVTAARTASGLLLPLRDLLSFAVYLSAFVARDVDWRGVRLTMEEEGRVSAARSSRA